MHKLNQPWSEGQGRGRSGQLPGGRAEVEEADRQGGAGAPQLLPLFQPGSSWKPDSQGAENWSPLAAAGTANGGGTNRSTQLREGSGRAFVKAMPVYSSLD